MTRHIIRLVGLFAICNLLITACGSAKEPECCYRISEDRPFFGLTDIDGAYFDPEAQRVILIGRRSDSFPPLQLADLAVLIRATQIKRGLGLSIEPKPIALFNRAAMGDADALNELRQYDKEKATESLREDQSVRYVGPIENTGVGMTFFEVDRFLKSLMMGQDNITGEPLPKEFSWHRDQFELMDELNGFPPLFAFVWFAPDIVQIVELNDAQGFSFEYPIKILVESRDIAQEIAGEIEDELRAAFPELADNPQELDRLLQTSNTLLDEFTDELESNYWRYAEYRPELKQLFQYTKLMAVLAWIEYYKIPENFDWINDVEFATVETPQTTPVIVINASIPALNPSETFPLFGGVDMKVGVQWAHSPRGTTETGNALKSMESCNHIFPCVGTNGWVAVPLSYITAQSDADVLSEARRGIQEVDGCFAKLGRAAERAALEVLRKEGASSSDLNVAIKDNMPVVDISTDSRLIQVGATLDWGKGVRVENLADKYEKFHGFKATDNLRTLQKAASELLIAQDRIELPTDFLTSDDPAGYLQNRTELWVPNNMIEPLTEELIRRGYLQDEFQPRIQSFGLNTSDLASLMPFDCFKNSTKGPSTFVPNIPNPSESYGR